MENIVLLYFSGEFTISAAKPWFVFACSKPRLREVGNSDDATHQLDYRLDRAGWLDCC